MSYKLYAVRIFCFKWKECVEFYKTTLGLPVFFEDENLGWAQFDVGGTYIGVERCDRQDKESSDLVGRFVGVSIQVEDIDAEYRQLGEKGVEFRGPPEKQPWGGTLLHLEDPDGNIITLLGDA